MFAERINDRVEKLKYNVADENLFIEEYKPFIASCVEKVTGRYMQYGKDDELSIALMAFSEAIKEYQQQKGSFLSFAQNIIKRRLIDYYRKEKKHSSSISINAYLEDSDEEIDMSEKQAIDKFSQEELGEYRRLEIENLKEELEQWGISLYELVGISPKHQETRRLYKQVIQYLLSHAQLINDIKKKQLLPIAEIEKNTKVPRKTIERSRKYIIAVILIMTGDYDYIKDFIDWR